LREPGIQLGEQMKGAIVVGDVRANRFRDDRRERIIEGLPYLEMDL
jgi:hypothetical protein